MRRYELPKQKVETMITLRDFLEEDLDTLVLYANNKKVSRYLVDTFPYPYTDADAQWWISKGSKEGITKVIIHNGAFVGSVGAIPKSYEKRYEASIGYWLGEPFWGQGIATIALQMLTEEIFSTTDIIRISAGVYSPNRASMRVLEKAGYEYEALLKKSIFKNNELYDEHIYSKFRS